MKNRLLILAVMSFAVMMTAAAAGADPIIHVEPLSIFTPTLYTGQTYAEHLYIYNEGDDKVNLTLKIDEECDWLSINQTEVTVDPKEEVAVIVNFGARAVPCMDGSYLNWIVIKPDDPMIPGVSVKVEIKTVASQIMYPIHNLIYFGSGQIIEEQLVRIQNAGCQVPLTITNITTDNTGRPVFWMPRMKFPVVVQPEEVFQFYLQFNAIPGLYGTYIGTMTIASDDPVRPLVYIPIRAIYTRSDPPFASSKAGPAVETSTWGAIKSLYE